MKKLTVLSSIVLLSFVAVQPGCSSSPDGLSRAGFDQIRQDVSTHADVESAIGPPDTRLADMWVYQRPDDHLTVLIDFDASGRVTRKQWVDGETGAWDDTKGTPRK